MAVVNIAVEVIFLGGGEARASKSGKRNLNTEHAEFAEKAKGEDCFAGEPRLASKAASQSIAPFERNYRGNWRAGG